MMQQNKELQKCSPSNAHRYLHTLKAGASIPLMTLTPWRWFNEGGETCFFWKPQNPKTMIFETWSVVWIESLDNFFYLSIVFTCFSYLSNFSIVSGSFICTTKYRLLNLIRFVILECLLKVYVSIHLDH